MILREHEAGIGSRGGFTLVELSIVLVILGLLVGGVLAGQSLIHAAELRAISNEYTSYKVAIGAFREKYMGLPGDITNATAFWGTEGVGSGHVEGPCDISGAVDTATCNGDGNGIVTGSGSAIIGLADYHENFRAWEQMANAGLIDGTYSGTSIYDDPDAGEIIHATPGVNTPRSRFSGAGWTIIAQPPANGSASYFAAPYKGITLMFGGPRVGGPNLLLPMGVMKPEDAYSFDRKLDDGLPQSGSVMSMKNINCLEATYDAYKVSSTTNGCTLLLLSGF